MHCLGAVTGGDSANPSGVSSRSCVVSVVRALGVLVCEGRIQGPPRGYKEGPHCAAPLQSPPNDHTCEKDNYLVSFIYSLFLSPFLSVFDPFPCSLMMTTRLVSSHFIRALSTSPFARAH